MADIQILAYQASRPLADEQLELGYAELPNHLVKKVRRYQRWVDRDLSMVGKLMLQYGLSLWGLPTDLTEMTTEMYGRPALPYPQVDFNISHSGHIVVTAISTAGRIGIDIEQVTPIEVSEYAKFFTSQEIHHIEQARDTSEAFFRLWTQKEAVVKADGRGLSLDKDQIHIQSNQGTIQENSWYLQPLPLADGYQAHLATPTANPTITLAPFSLDSIPHT